MRKSIFFLLCLLIGNLNFAQSYLPTWASLDSRPVPPWFGESKFGIFIHWGVYAVPAYTAKGGYAEWYQNGLEKGDSAKKAYQLAKFGNQTYYQLANQFKAELFNPDEWAKLIEQSGAKYIVLTSKHHDGFALWPSKEASRTWGFPWNAGEVGPKRDLLGDLFKAVRKTSVHAGMYYSLYEWFNPLWKKDQNQYATEHMWPQMKELINTYQPDVFWTDGDWDASENIWKSKEFLAWLYNESPVKDKVVTYDRWGSGVRFKHGAVYTPEYQPELDFEDHAWEESRGMGYSYGYNRVEDAWDYNSAQSLVYHLIDKVSRGGNFLLDIGPDEHGKIPPIMQERLLDIGKWLKINGEAIYHTSRWRTVSQWSEGRRDYKTKNGEDIMLKLTVAPDSGFGVKEVFYTYNQQTNSLYAIFPKYPASGKLILKNLPLPSSIHDVHFLATNEKLAIQNKGNDLIVSLPAYDPNKIESPYAYVVKISNYGAYDKKVKINIIYLEDLSGAQISISAKEPDAKIYYTINHSKNSAPYNAPFTVKGDITIQAIAIARNSFIPADTAEAIITGLNQLAAIKPKQIIAGLHFSYFEADNMNMEKLKNAKPINEGVTNEILLTIKQRKEKFGIIFDGYISIEKTGGYTFFSQSDDGSILTIDDKEIVNNDGNHGFDEKEGKCILEKGYHRFKLFYFDSGGGNDLSVKYQPFGKEKTSIPASLLFH